jgi:hypothetical protein
VPAPFITNKMLNRAIEMREDGATLAYIAGQVGCSEKALSYHFLKNAVEPPNPRPLRPEHYLQCPLVKRGDHVVRAFAPDEDARLMDLEAQGLKDSDIGRILQRKPNSVRGRLMTLARRDERASINAVLKPLTTSKRNQGVSS